MTEIAGKKERVKKDVRSLLLSSPLPLTVKELQNDYHNFIGGPIDFRGMGYTTLVDFLRDIEDAVDISWDRGIMVLTAKASIADQHIQKLVSKQKVQNKRKYAVNRQLFSWSGPTRVFQGEYRTPRHKQGTLLTPAPVIPAYMRKELRELVNSYPDGIVLTNFNDCYYKQFCTRINFCKYGFQYLMDFLKSLSDVVIVEQLANGEQLVLPVLHSQRPCSRASHLDGPNDEFQSKENRLTFKEHVQYSSHAVSLLEEQRPCSGRSCLDGPNDRFRSKESRLTFEEQVQYSSSAISSSLLENRKERPSRGRGRRKDGVCLKDEPIDRKNSLANEQAIKVGQFKDVVELTIGSKSNLANEQTSIVDEFEDVVELALEMEVKQVLEMFPEGIWASNFIYEYKNIFGKNLDFRVLGYLSVIDMIASIPNVARIERPDPKGDWMLYDIRVPRPEISDITKLPKQSKSDSIKEDIQKVLRANPSGLLVKEFSYVFEDYTGREFFVKDLGFSSLNDLFLSMADSNLQIAYTRYDGLKIYPKEAKLPSSEAPEKPLFPEVIGLGSHYTQVVCPWPNTFVDLFVSNIVNPGIFWVIFRHKSNSLALETLMDNLEHVYGDDSNDYKMPESQMVPGQVCAAIFPEDNNWHRCMITKPCSKEGFVEVYYVDYGNCNEVQQNNIRFLKAEFFMLPAQAVQCRLANIHPVAKSMKWMNSSKDKMMDLCRKRPLVAYVCDVKNQIMSVCLVNTNTPNIDIHINDVLVNEGYAVFKPDTEVPPEWLIYCHTKVPDYGLVFGYTSPEIPCLPKLTHNPLTQSKKHLGSSSGHCYVQRVQLTKDHTIHLVNLEMIAYIVSSEISSLYWEDDILTSMLQQKKMNVNKRQINNVEYPELFKELLKFQVKSLKADGKCQYLSLYTLDSVPAILETFGPDSKDLIGAVKELVTTFDPDSPCWKEKFKDIEEAEDNCTEVHLSIDEKQMLLRTLQFKRKRILQLLMNGAAIATDNTVNQLDDVERKITMITEEIEEQTLQEKITQIAERKTETIPTIKAQMDQVEESQHHILNIIASTAKPVATANIMTKATTSTSNPKPNINVIGFSNQPICVNNFNTQTVIGSNYPDMKAVSTSINNSLLTQAGPPLGDSFGDMDNLGASINMIPGTNIANVLNPLLFQPFQTASASSTTLGISNMDLCNPFQSFGRGVALDPTSVGILPGLLPLIQNLKVGQWGRGRGDCNN